MMTSLFASVTTDFLPAPAGPNTPFGSPGLIVLDTIRVVVLSLGVLIICSVPFAMKHVRTPGQTVRLLSLGLFAIIAMGTEFDHMGDYANWRLIFSILATLAGAWGTWSLFRWESPSFITPLRESSTEE